MKRFMILVTGILSALLIACAFAGSATAAVFWKQIDGPSEVEPAALVTSLGTSSSTIRFHDLIWEGWGTSQAVGTGRATTNGCRPNCLAGDNVEGDAVVTLSRIRSVCGQRRYMHIQMRTYNFPRGVGPYETNFPDVSCRGNMVNPGGKPYPNRTPDVKPKPKPKPKPKIEVGFGKYAKRPGHLVLGVRAEMTDIHWTHWGHKSAIGRGKFYVGASFGQPDSGIGPVRARITYRRVFRCTSRLRVFVKSSLRYGPGLRKRVHLPHNPSPCSGP